MDVFGFTDRQTIYDVLSQKTLYFSLEDFKEKIVDGECCFICGVSPEVRPFNDEHVIPDWLLKRFNLHARRITLPNGASTMYGSYKVPCCAECNSLLGKETEEPISRILSQSYSEIMKAIDHRPEIVHDIFRWLCLIYVKTHLKDKSFRRSLDRRVDSGMIADDHEWEEIHHIHCLARTAYTQAQIDLRVYGTIFIVTVLLGEGEEDFDYVDVSLGKTVYLQLGRIGIIAVLNDSCAGYSFYLPTIQKITGPLSKLQIREIMANLNYINLHLKYRPKYFSTIGENGYEIGVDLPDSLELIPAEERIPLGEIILGMAKQVLPDNTGEELMALIRSGMWTSLFNERGEFLDNQIHLPGNNWSTL